MIVRGKSALVTKSYPMGLLRLANDDSLREKGYEPPKPKSIGIHAKSTELGSDAGRIVIHDRTPSLYRHFDSNSVLTGHIWSAQSNPL